MTTHTPTEFFQPVIDAITANPIFIQFGLGIVFIMAVIPFWPIPIEPLAVFMILAEEESLREATLWNYAITIGIGAYISMVIAFYGGRHLHRLIGKKRKDMTDSHWFHKYGIYTLLAIPTISIALPFFIDAVMVALGHYRTKPMMVLSFAFIGNLIRIYIAGEYILKPLAGL